MQLIPVTKPDANKLRAAYQLVSDMAVQWNGRLVNVPGGFQYDGASIPRALWTIVGNPFEPQFMRAALAHDWLYHVHTYDRQESDALFSGLLQEDGVSKAKAETMRAGIRAFGGRYWNNDAMDADYLWRLRHQLIADHRNPADYGLGEIP